jgi:hypothetical protein
MYEAKEAKRSEIRVYKDGVLALIGRMSRLFYILTAETQFIGELDLYELPPTLFTGVFEVQVKPGRVTVKNGVWRKAAVCENGEYKTVYNMSGNEPLEQPGRQVRMVTYIPSWVNAVTLYDMSITNNIDQLFSRYAHASDRYKRALEELVADTDTIMVADAGGWPGLIYKVWTHRGGADNSQFAELIYAGVDSDTLDPRSVLAEHFPSALYCGRQKEFKQARERGKTIAWKNSSTEGGVVHSLF